MSKTKIIVLCLSCLCSLVMVFAQSVESKEHYYRVTGYVFNDINKNQTFDAFEKGVKGVLVSSKTEIVLTDKNGKYSLNLFGDEDIVFMIKPAGLTVPLDRNNLPLFYHFIEKEQPLLMQFPGGKVAGSNSESYDFPVNKSTVRDTFEFIAMADPQSKKLIELYYLRDDVVSELISTNADFTITMGDIVHDDLSLFERHNEIMSKIGVPVYNLPGNHDIDFNASDDIDALNTYMSIYGPSYYAFEYGKANFVMLDNVEWMGKQDERNKGSYRGMIGDAQLNWVRNYLKYVPSDHLVVMAMHIPLYYSGSPDPAVNVVDRKKLLALLDGFENILFIAGHMHMIEHSFLDEDVGWRGKKKLHHITCSAASGAWWTGPKDERGIPETFQRDGSPNGYHVFEICGNKYNEYFKAAGMDKEFQVRISSPSAKINRSSVDTIPIVVNIFNGSERSTVKYKIDEGDEYDMINRVMIDPYILSEYNRPDSKYSQTYGPLPCNHIWTAEMPSGLSTGKHKITIRTVDIYGNEYTESIDFEIE